MTSTPSFEKDLLITIDGPAGAGKTTVSRMLAARLGYTYVDTGALYRGVAVAVQRAGIAPDDDAALEKLGREIELRFKIFDDQPRLLLNNVDITDEIRDPEITMLASAVSARPVVRSCLLGLQRALGRRKAAVFEGRDMGTVVFPDADVKFYLDADPKARVQRRYNELAPQKNIALADIEKDMCQRDRNDSNRQAAPLKPAPDAIFVDSTHMSAEQVVASMEQHIARAG